METIYRDDIFSFKELIATFIKHIRKFILISIIGFLMSIIYLVLAVPSYSAITTISIDSLKDLTAWDNRVQEKTSIDTEMLFIKNQGTITSALNKLNLSSYIYDNGKTYENLLADKRPIKVLQNSITVSKISGTDFVNVTFKHSNPLFAQDFLSMLMSTYREVLLTYADAQVERDYQELMTKFVIYEEKLSDLKEELAAIVKSDTAGNNELSEMLAISQDQSQVSGMDSISINLAIKYPHVKEKIETFNKANAMYTDLLVQKTLIDAFRASSREGIHVIDQVKLVDEDDGIDGLRILIYGLTLSVFLALFFIILIEYFSDIIDTEQVLHKILGREVPVLGTIPPAIKGFEKTLEILYRPKSHTSIAFNRLSGILANFNERNVYLFTRIGDVGGGSYSIMNIALSLLNSGKKVLFFSLNNIDFCNELISSESNKESNLANKVSLSLYNPAIKISMNQNLECLHIMTLDVSDKDQQYLIYSQNFKKLIEDASNAYDFVLIDGPSIDNPSDLLAIAKISNGTILDVQSFIKAKKHLYLLIRTLRNCNTPIIGCIYNNLYGLSSKKQKRI